MICRRRCVACRVDPFSSGTHRRPSSATGSDDQGTPLHATQVKTCDLRTQAVNRLCIIQTSLTTSLMGAFLHPANCNCAIIPCVVSISWGERCELRAASCELARGESGHLGRTLRAASQPYLHGTHKAAETTKPKFAALALEAMLLKGRIDPANIVRDARICGDARRQ